MLPSLQELLSEIEAGAIPLQDALQSADCDELLDLRDLSPSFDNAYSEAFAKIEDLRSSLPYDPTERIRQQAFVLFPSRPIIMKLLPTCPTTLN